MIFFRLISLASLVFYVFAPISTHAAEALSFIPKSELNDFSLIKLTAQHDFTHVSLVDLNNDSFDEVVLRRDASNGLFVYDIFAVFGARLVALSTIEARKLSPSFGEKNGVRNILAYSDSENDFKYQTYVWDAMHSKYVLEGQEMVSGEVQ